MEFKLSHYVIRIYQCIPLLSLNSGSYEDRIPKVKAHKPFYCDLEINFIFSPFGWEAVGGIGSEGTVYLFAKEGLPACWW